LLAPRLSAFWTIWVAVEQQNSLPSIFFFSDNIKNTRKTLKNTWTSPLPSSRWFLTRQTSSTCVSPFKKVQFSSSFFFSSLLLRLTTHSRLGSLVGLCLGGYDIRVLLSQSSQTEPSSQPSTIFFRR
jgi:hypothetical protein